MFPYLSLYDLENYCTIVLTVNALHRYLQKQRAERWGGKKKENFVITGTLEKKEDTYEQLSYFTVVLWY